MPSLNKVTLIGNLTRDPEVRYTPKGTAVSNIGLGINRKWRDEAGNWQEEATFVDVTLWGKNAENVGKHLTKGSCVFIEGRLHLETWEDKQTGQKRSKLKVVGDMVQFLGSPNRDGGQQQAPARRTAADAYDDAQAGDAAPADGDDIPF